MTNAWHLRNDGAAFPIQVHIYPMQDSDLASEAEVASFIISTNSQDQEYAQYVLDAFMALRIENSVSFDAEEEEIDSAILDALQHLPFKFAYPLSDEQMLEIHHTCNNYNDVDSLYDFIDEVRNTISDIWSTIKDSFNQQFCRVRYGGQFQTTKGNSGIWFRIASVGFNWDDVIYMFASDISKKYHIEYITICRDNESDGTEEDYFYKAKDGEAYYYMPLKEFFSEEHGRNPVFSATMRGRRVVGAIRSQLSKGRTFLYACSMLEKKGIYGSAQYRSYLYETEIAKQWIKASEWFDALNTRTKMKLGKVKSMLQREYPEIIDMDIDFNPRENSKGNPVGFELIFTLVSEHPDIDNVPISIVSTKSLSSTQADTLARMFRREYDDYIDYKQIRL